jgi:hypothetical protein
MRRLLIFIFGAAALACAQTPVILTGSVNARISDGSNAVTIKPASTPAAAADPALVVTFSPNSPATIKAQDGSGNVLTSTAGALDVNLKAGSDPCFGNGEKRSAVIDVGSATTAELLSAESLKHVYVCSITATVSGTNPIVQLKTGTKASTACDTSAVNLTGTFAPTSGSLLTLGNGGSTILKSIVSGEICVTTTGTSPSLQGVITYVQQ